MKLTDDLEARLMTRLQECKHGQTMKQLEEFLDAPDSEIRRILNPYLEEGHVRVSASGVWAMVRQ